MLSFYNNKCLFGYVLLFIVIIFNRYCVKKVIEINEDLFKVIG